MNFLRGCAHDTAMWGKMYGGSLLDLIPFPRRLSFSEPDVQILWAAGDAALVRFSAIGWATKEYVVADAMEFPTKSTRGADNSRSAIRSNWPPQSPLRCAEKRSAYY